MKRFFPLLITALVIGLFALTGCKKEAAPVAAPAETPAPAEAAAPAPAEESDPLLKDGLSEAITVIDEVAALEVK